MASAFITTRTTKAGKKRFVVRFRLGGRAYPIEHGGAFGTLKEARVRRDLIAGELAAGRNPAEVLRALAETPKTRTFAEWATAWKGSRVDVAEETLRMYGKALARLKPTFSDFDPATITPSDVQEWIGANADLSPNTVSKYLGVLRAILDFAGLEQANPARDRRVRLPRIEVSVLEPPSAEDVAATRQRPPALAPAHPRPRADGNEGRRTPRARMAGRGRVRLALPHPRGEDALGAALGRRARGDHGRDRGDDAAGRSHARAASVRRLGAEQPAGLHAPRL
jgi:hypothetical protein